MRTTPQTYPEYKRTLISGLVNLPAHWQVARLKRLCKRHSLYGANIPATEYLSSGIRFLRTTDITDHGHLTGEGVHLPAQAVTEYILSDGDILVSRSGTVGRSFLYRSDIHGPCAYAGYLVRFVPKTRQIADYIYLFTKTLAFQEFLRTAAISSTIENVNAEKYANCLLPVPPPDEQASIVHYLDHADELINRYISAKERLITLMEEQRQAVIHQAVTRGLDPDVLMKPTGIPWLPEIPKHWAKHSISSVARPKSISGHPEQELLSVYLHQGVIKFSDVDEKRTNATSEDLANYQLVEPGDFVLNNQQAWRGSVGVSNHTGIVSPAYLVLSISPELQPTYANALFRDKSLVDQYLVASRGVGTIQRNLYWPHLKKVELPIPPKEEQHKIVDHLNKITKATESVVSHAQSQIDLMNEYRTRLIADVVTGQTDVRNATVELPD